MRIYVFEVDSHVFLNSLKSLKSIFMVSSAFSARRRILPPV